MIYWDSNSTSRLRNVAVDAIKVMLIENRALNPSSIHQEGRYARGILRNAKELVLSYLFPNCFEKNRAARLMFVSGGTEACNSLIHGFLNHNFLKSEHIVSSAIEHAAMLESIKKYEKLGVEVSLVNANKEGQVFPSHILSNVRENTSLVSLMLANNENGRGQSVVELAKLLKEKYPQVVLISDVSQAISKTDFDLAKLFDAGVDAVVISAHKIGALSGIGGIVFNTKSTCRLFNPLILGGGQEDKLRGGTEFLLGAHVFGITCSYLADNRDELRKRRDLKDFLIRRIEDELHGLKIVFKNASPHEYDLCNTVYVSTIDTKIRADDFVVALDIEGLLVSTGSACSSGRQDVSHVPLAMGYDKEEARHLFRISLDWDANEDQINQGVELMKKVLNRKV
jgi:cysteine desulfurase